MSKGIYNNPRPCVDCEKGPWYAGRGCGCQDFCQELEAYKGAERMIYHGTERNEQLEGIIELTQGLFEEEGYKTVRFSETTNHGTTAYDCLVLQDAEGNEFSITFDKSDGKTQISLARNRGRNNGKV